MSGGVLAGLTICAHDGFAHLTLLQQIDGTGEPVPVAQIQLDQRHSYSVAAALIEAVGPTDLLDEQLRTARAQVLIEVRTALLDEASRIRPDFPTEFLAGMTAGVNTAIQRVDAIRATNRKEHPHG